MHVHQDEFIVSTSGRSISDVTGQVASAVANARVTTGLCTVFIHHTSASLFINENADPSVRRDLEAFLSRLVPDADPLYEHTAEGPDDMPAHVRTLLTRTSLSLPISAGRLALGTWQGIFLWEHRHRGHRRRISVTVLGE